MFGKYKIVSKTRFTISVMIFILLATAVISLLFGNNEVNSASYMQYDTVVVKPGDTLWNIASSHNTNGTDIRELIYEISSINELSGEFIVPGQTLMIPIG